MTGKSASMAGLKKVNDLWYLHLTSYPLCLYVAGVGIALVYYLFNRVWEGTSMNTTSVGFYSGCVAIDIINTAILAYMLLSYRTQTTYQQTRSISTTSFQLVH